MGGVGRVAPEHPAGSDDVDRRLGFEHRADLHRRGVGAQHRGAGFTAGRDVVDEQRVPLAAGGMPDRHVERFEVVPVGLDLGAFGDLEAETDEHVLEPFPCLGDQMGVTAGRLADELGEVEPFGLDPACERLGAERGPAGLERVRDRGQRLVDGLAGGLLVVDRLERTEPGLQLGEVALLAGELGWSATRRRRACRRRRSRRGPHRGRR